MSPCPRAKCVPAKPSPCSHVNAPCDCRTGGAECSGDSASRHSCPAMRPRPVAKAHDADGAKPVLTPTSASAPSSATPAPPLTRRQRSSARPQRAPRAAQPRPTQYVPRSLRSPHHVRWPRPKQARAATRSPGGLRRQPWGGYNRPDSTPVCTPHDDLRHPPRRRPHKSGPSASQRLTALLPRKAKKPKAKDSKGRLDLHSAPRVASQSRKTSL